MQNNRDRESYIQGVRDLYSLLVRTQTFYGLEEMVNSLINEKEEKHENEVFVEKEITSTKVLENTRIPNTEWYFKRFRYIKQKNEFNSIFSNRIEGTTPTHDDFIDLVYLLEKDSQYIKSMDKTFYLLPPDHPHDYFKLAIAIVLTKEGREKLLC